MGQVEEVYIERKQPNTKQVRGFTNMLNNTLSDQNLNNHSSYKKSEKVCMFVHMLH
jgi:hypothetical protein